MRVLLILLIMANIGYFAWYNYFRPAAPVSIVRSKTITAQLPSLTLLGEPGAERAGRQAASVSLPDAENGLMLLGGFFDQATASAFEHRMLELGIDGQLVRQERPAEQEYWVYLPPLSSRAATLRLLKELQARKLDGFLIAQGELANGISLGIFPHENSAEAILERLRQGGYQAQIKKISRKQEVFWFEVSSGSERLIDEATLQVLLKHFPGMQYTQGIIPAA